MTSHFRQKRRVFENDLAILTLCGLLTIRVEKEANKGMIAFLPFAVIGHQMIVRLQSGLEGGRVEKKVKQKFR